jgi:hypothetical protein
MRLRATVRTDTGKTRHCLGEIVDGRPVAGTELPSPVSLEISGEEGGFFLFRLNADGVCIADTWHATVAEAMRQAMFEYATAADEWLDVELS